jgi:hypothetical protein
LHGAKLLQARKTMLWTASFPMPSELLLQEHRDPEPMRHRPNLNTSNWALH